MDEKKMSFSEKENITLKRIAYVFWAFIIGGLVVRPLLALSGLLGIPG